MRLPEQAHFNCYLKFAPTIHQLDIYCIVSILNFNHFSDKSEPVEIVYLFSHSQIDICLLLLCIYSNSLHVMMTPLCYYKTAICWKKESVFRKNGDYFENKKRILRRNEKVLQKLPLD